MMASSQLRRRLWIVSLALVAGALAIGAIAARRSPAPGAPAPRFALLDHEGLPFGRERLEGRWSLIFFGYAHCPDVCPLALQLAHQARQQLLESSGAEPPPLIFVSLDPEQDTPAALKDYVQRFDASFLGVTGPSAEVARLEDWLASAHRVGAERIDHGAYLYVIDPQARAAGRIEGVGEPRALAERIRAAISAERG